MRARGVRGTVRSQLPPQRSDEIEELEPPSQSKGMRGGASKNRRDRGFELERIRGVHEHLQKRRAIVCTNQAEHGPDFTTMLALVNAQSARTEVVRAEGSVDGVGGFSGRAHSHENSRREHRIKKRRGVADEEKPVPSISSGLVREIGDRADGLHLRGPRHSALQGAGAFDLRQEVAFDVVAMEPKNVLGDDGPHAREAVSKGDDPEPMAVAEGDDTDVAGVLALVAIDVAKVSEDGEAPRVVGSLETESGREERVLAAGVDEHVGVESVSARSMRCHGDVETSGSGNDRGNRSAFTHIGAHLSSAFQEEVIEIGAEHLIGHGLARKETIPKIELANVVSALTHELGAEFLGVSAFLDLVVNAELVEQVEVFGKQGFAHVESGESLFLENDGVVSLLSKIHGRGRAGRATADHGDIARVPAHGGSRIPRGGTIKVMASPFLAGFEKLVAERGDAPAILALSERRVLSFEDLAREYQATKTTFAGAKIPEGSCVVALAGNNASWFSLFLACVARGDALLSLDDDMTPEEARGVASRYGAAAMVVPASRHDLRPEASAALPGELIVSVLDDRDPKSFGDARLLKLTSGSSGEPKAVRVTEENLWNDARHIVEAMGIRPQDVNYGVIPLSHSYGLGNLVAPLFLQGTPVALRRMFVPGQLFDDVAETGATVLPGVPFLFQKILEQHGEAGLPSSLRLLVTAGAPIDPGLVAAFKGGLGIKIHSFYGSSETGGITYDDEEDLTDPLNVGKAMPETEVTLRSDARAPSGERRVHVRGNAVALGYVEALDDEGFTEFVDGGFTTGDLGEIDESGRLYLTGRLTSFVNVAGRKVDPREAEGVLLEMPEIADAKVLGLPCEKRGQKLVAFIVPVSETEKLRPAQVRTHCARKLSPHKIPRDMILLDAMPVTPRGKVDRRALWALTAEAEDIADVSGI